MKIEEAQRCHLCGGLGTNDEVTQRHRAPMADEDCPGDPDLRKTENVID